MDSDAYSEDLASGDEGRDFSDEVSLWGSDDDLSSSSAHCVEIDDDEEASGVDENEGPVSGSEQGGSSGGDRFDRSLRLDSEELNEAWRLVSEGRRRPRQRSLSARIRRSEREREHRLRRRRASERPMRPGEIDPAGEAELRRRRERRRRWDAELRDSDARLAERRRRRRLREEELARRYGEPPGSLRRRKRGGRKERLRKIYRLEQHRLDTEELRALDRRLDIVRRRLAHEESWEAMQRRERDELRREERPRYRQESPPRRREIVHRLPSPHRREPRRSELEVERRHERERSPLRERIVRCRSRSPRRYEEHASCRYVYASPPRHVRRNSRSLDYHWEMSRSRVDVADPCGDRRRHPREASPRRRSLPQHVSRERIPLHRVESPRRSLVITSSRTPLCRMSPPPRYVSPPPSHRSRRRSLSPPLRESRSRLSEGHSHRRSRHSPPSVLRPLACAPSRTSASADERRSMNSLQRRLVRLSK